MSYAPLPGASSSKLSLRADEDERDEDTEGLTEQEEGDKHGLLTGARKHGAGDESTDEPTVEQLASRPTFAARFGRTPVRTILLLSLSAGAVVLLILFFHPSSPFSLPAYYSGADLTPGVYDPSAAAIAKNPLPDGAKFGDIPFASVGASKAEDSALPAWAGGTGAHAEQALLRGDRWKQIDGLKSNGTRVFNRTVIMISMDGVRADYLDRGLTPHILRIAEKGLRAKFMLPVFPSLTFPNHWSLLTGLLPSSHGIVANDFLDPSTGKEFIYTKPENSWAPDWWGGEPIWATAEKAGLRTGNIMWPGPPAMADGTRPSKWYAFENKYAFERKVDKIFKMLDEPLGKRPQLILAYAPEVDQEGHRSGPSSAKLTATLEEMDRFAKAIFDGLEERNLDDVVDVVMLSDHGMTTTANEKLVFLDDLLGPEGFAGIERNEGWPCAGLRFAPSINEQEMLGKLRNASEGSDGGFHVYTAEDMPDRWHFTGNDRIAPVYVVPHAGWAITSRKEFHIDMNGDYHPKGNHGYDPHSSPDMRAFFTLHGPSASRIKATLAKKEKRAAGKPTIIEGFNNLEVYSLVAGLLGIPESRRAPTNGTEGFWSQYFDGPI